jgi:hypothetical protein
LRLARRVLIDTFTSDFAERDVLLAGPEKAASHYVRDEICPLEIPIAMARAVVKIVTTARFVADAENPMDEAAADAVMAK